MKSVLLRGFLYTSLAVITCLLLIVVTCFIFVDEKESSEYIKLQIISAARANGVMASIKEASLSLKELSLTLRNIDLTSVRYPITAHIDELQLSVIPKSIFSLAPTFLFSGSAYRGSFSGVVSASLHDEMIRSQSVLINNLDLGSHPQIQGLGISRGMFRLSCSTEGVKLPATERTRCEFQLTDLEKPYATILPRTWIHLPMDITIPALQINSLAVKASGTREEISLYDLLLRSSLVSGDGNLRLSQKNGAGQSTRIRFVPRGTLHGALTEAGRQSIGSWLSLLSQGVLPADTERFSMYFEEQRGKEVTRFEKVTSKMPLKAAIPPTEQQGLALPTK